MKKYVFKPYSKIFPELFLKEKERIAAHVKMALAIEHVGSTAIPNLGGKGIIDIAVAANKPDLVPDHENLCDFCHVKAPGLRSSTRGEVLNEIHPPLSITQSRELSRSTNRKDFCGQALEAATKEPLFRKVADLLDKETL